MIVYVIEEGEYSDRFVVAVRETLEEAKAYVELKLKASDYRHYPEEYSISAFDTKSGEVYSQDAYNVDFRDGKLQKLQKRNKNSNTWIKAMADIVCLFTQRMRNRREKSPMTD